ncbi:MAG: oxygenase MpaB family protein [Mycolicibacterium insubricum]|nr:DUF2236 domain-containing protein [Mycobacterium sp.]
MTSASPSMIDRVKTRVRRRNWVDQRIATLDPETDYPEITRLIAEYQLNDFAYNLSYAVGFHYITIPSAGSRAIAGTGKAQNRPQTRYFDTADSFMRWMLLGPNHPEVKQSVARIQRMHNSVARSFPESFSEEEDFIYSYAVFTLTSARMREVAGAPPRPQSELIAVHHFWRDISEQLHSTSGRPSTYPSTVEEMVSYADEIESREYPPTPDGRIVSNAMIDQFSDRYFRGRLKPLGRAMILAFVSDRVQHRQDVVRANPVLVYAVRKAFRAYFFLQDHVLPPTRRPFSVLLQSEEWKDMRKEWRTAEVSANPNRSGLNREPIKTGAEAGR